MPALNATGEGIRGYWWMKTKLQMPGLEAGDWVKGYWWIKLRLLVPGLEAGE